MKLILQSYAEQLVEKEIPLGVLISWIIVKCDQHHASVTDVKRTLCGLTKSEHCLFRMNCIVEFAEKLSREAEFPLEQLIDKRVLQECLILCSLEVRKQKKP